MSKSHEVTIAHALFAYTVDGRQRIALRGESVEVSPEEFKAGTETGAFVVPAEEAEPTPANPEELDITQGVDDVKKWVGEDPERARQALEAEQGTGKARSTLVEHLTKVAG